MIGEELLNLIRGPVLPPGTLGGAPNPTPNPGQPLPQGQGQGGQVAPAQGGAPQNPSAAPQSPPDLAQLYMQLDARNRSANEIDRGLTTMAAAFSTPQMASALMGNMPQQQDAGAQLGNMLRLQQQQTMMRQQQAAAAGAEGAFTSLFPGAKPGLGTELFNMGKLGDVMTAHIASMNPTEQQKNVDAATNAWAAANPNAKPEDIAGFKANLMAGAVGGTDLDQRQYQSAVQSGQFHGTYTDWRNQGMASGKQAADYATEKADAANSFTPVDASWKSVQDNLDWLNKNKDAAIVAIQHPDWETTGQIGRNLPTFFGGQPQDVLDAKNRLVQLQAQLKTEAFRNTKNVRSNKEAQFLGDAASPIFSPTNSPDAITSGLETLQTQAITGRANATAAAGRPIPSEWAGNVDPALLDRTNPLYNGATIQAPQKAPNAGPTPSPAQIQKLRSNPERAAEFDQLFGPGASKRILGQ
jgi:hypothetical protein